MVFFECSTQFKMDFQTLRKTFLLQILETNFQSFLIWEHLKKQNHSKILIFIATQLGESVNPINVSYDIYWTFSSIF